MTASTTRFFPNSASAWSRERRNCVCWTRCSLCLWSEGLLKAGGRQRTDSTHVLAAVRVLNRLELVGETLRHALESLAILVPDWLQRQVPVEWYDRYGSRMDNYRFPKSDKARQELAARSERTDCCFGESGSGHQDALAAGNRGVMTLRQVWSDQFTDPPGPLALRKARSEAPSAELIASPYDTEARYSTKREMLLGWLQSASDRDL